MQVSLHPGGAYGMSYHAGENHGADIGVAKNEDVRSKPQKSAQMRELLRNVNNTVKSSVNPYEVSTREHYNGYSPAAKTEKKTQKPTKSYRYNYKDVASRILRAKTSLGAAQAVISAKRKVAEVQRKISAGSGDAEELQLALTHARRMEMVARKKKHHLELEELVERTGQSDENAQQAETVAKSAANDVSGQAQETVSEAEDAIFEERQEILSGTMEEWKESGEEITEEMTEELNALISEIGEEELEALEEAMEALESMEIIDPHMSEEDFENLKRKHRSQEERAMMKANMDYLKEMIKHQMASMKQAAQTAVSVSQGGVSVAATGAVSFESSGGGAVLELAMPGGGEVLSVPSAGFDVQV